MVTSKEFGAGDMHPLLAKPPGRIWPMVLADQRSAANRIPVGVQAGCGSSPSNLLRHILNSRPGLKAGAADGSPGRLASWSTRLLSRPRLSGLMIWISRGGCPDQPVLVVPTTVPSNRSRISCGRSTRALAPPASSSSRKRYPQRTPTGNIAAPAAVCISTPLSPR